MQAINIVHSVALCILRLKCSQCFQSLFTVLSGRFYLYDQVLYSSAQDLDKADKHPSTKSKPFKRLRMSNDSEHEEAIEVTDDINSYKSITHQDTGVCDAEDNDFQWSFEFHPDDHDLELLQVYIRGRLFERRLVLILD